MTLTPTMATKAARDFTGARLRRKLPLDSLERDLRKRLGKAVRAVERKSMGRLESSGILRRLEADAQKRAGEKRGPVGRGGIPFGPEREAELERIFAFDEIDAVGRLFRDEEDAFRIEMEGALKDSYRQAYDRGGMAARKELGVRGSFKLRHPGIIDALESRANMLAGDIAEDVFDRLKTVIADGFYLEGRSPLDVARSLAEEFDWLTDARAERIARTETLSITEEAQLTVYQASGVPFKRWITTLDGKERDTHFEAHGQMVPVDEPFIVGGEKLMYPGDPDAPPQEIVNCRCATEPVVSEEQILSDADVWRGDLDPDEFARDRSRVVDELTEGPRPPAAVDERDLQFADENL